MASRALALEPIEAEQTKELETHGMTGAQSEPDGFAVPSHDEIAILAHSYWLERGPEAGSAEDDWYRAEGELKSRRQRQ